MLAKGVVYSTHARDYIYMYSVQSENLNCRNRSQGLSSDTIQIDKEVGGENLGWLYLGQDRTTVMNLRFP